MVVRDAVPGDVAKLVDLVLQLARYERAEEAALATEEDFRRALFCPSPEVFALVADRAGEVIGIAVYFVSFSTWTGRHGLYLEDLFVVPEHRSRGTGRALLGALAARAVERGCARLEWAVLDWNQPAIDFYHSLGAVAVEGWTTFRLSGAALAALGQRSAWPRGCLGLPRLQPLHSRSTESRATRGGTDAHHNDCPRQARSGRDRRLVARRSGHRRRCRPPANASPIKVPAKYASGITMAMDATYPPDEFVHNGTDRRLRRRPGLAIGKVLGVKVTLHERHFRHHHPRRPGRQVRRRQLVVHRHQGPRAAGDFIDYFKAGEGYYEKARHKAYNGLKALCGHSVAVETGTTEQTDAQAPGQAVQASTSSASRTRTRPTWPCPTAGPRSVSPTPRWPPTSSTCPTGSSS